MPAAHTLALTRQSVTTRVRIESDAIIPKAGVNQHGD